MMAFDFTSYEPVLFFPQVHVYFDGCYSFFNQQVQFIYFNSESTTSTYNCLMLLTQLYLHY